MLKIAFWSVNMIRSDNWYTRQNPSINVQTLKYYQLSKREVCRKWHDMLSCFVHTTFGIKYQLQSWNFW